MIELKVEIIIKAKLASLTQAAITKLERGGVRVVTIERSAKRCTVHGTLRVRAKPRHIPGKHCACIKCDPRQVQ